MWYLNKYTSIRDYLVEDIVRKNYASICKKSSPQEDLEEDPEEEDSEDVPAPLS